MAEQFRNAWQSWRLFSYNGKLAAALLVSLLFLWVYYKRVKQKDFLIYTTVVTLLCILPFTAVLLERYQTFVYDYKWIWSLVPVTAMVGFAATLFTAEFLQELTGGNRKRQIAAVVLLAAALVFCSGMGRKPWEGYGGQAERRRAETLLAEIQKRSQETQICLWAPRNVLEYARAYDADIRLLYGRDMWEAELNAYCYDDYPEEFGELYRWMEAPYWEETAPGVRCLEEAAASGVNCILVPAHKPGEMIERLENVLGLQAQRLEEYYLLIR